MTRRAAPPDPATLQVRAAAASSPDWAVLAERARACTACPELAATRQHVVVGTAPSHARLLLLGEAPGAQEDVTGQPFVGKAGQLLDRVLGEVGLDRQRVAVLNTLKCRPPGNRAPTRLESAHCRGWTERQVTLIDPALIVTLGLTATAWALGRGPLAAVRGQVHDLHGRRVLPTYHPSAAIRFGPAGAPLAALRADLALAASLL